MFKYMNNSILMEDMNFELILGKEAIWPDLTEELAKVFSLIHIRRGRKRFENYLESPFFVEDGTAMGKLFLYLFPRLRKGSKKIQVRRLIKAVYGENIDFDACKRRLKTLVQDLCAEVIRFNSYLHLEDTPAEMERLRTMSLRNKGLSERYRAEQKKWVVASQNLPVGTNGAFHRWAALDAGYLGLDVPKASFDTERFNGIWSALHGFCAVQKSIYEMEIARRPDVKDSLRNLTHAAETTGPEAVLISLYRQVTSLLAASTEVPGQYRKLKRDLLRFASSIDAENRLGVVFGTLNYLQDLYAKGDLKLRDEMFFWPHLLLKSGTYKLIPVIPKQHFNNQLQRALINDQMWLARKVRDELSTQLPLNVRAYVSEHIKLAFDFHEGRFRSVIESTEKISITRFRPENQSEVLRLKTYQIRSYLACLATDPLDDELHEDIIKSLKTLDKYIESYSEDQLFGMADRSLVYRRFRTLARLTYNYLRDRPFYKSASTDKIVAFINEDKPLACRNWFVDFIGRV